MREAATILRPGDAVVKSNSELVRPTLLIGLGGTGREVLLRLRQRFVEKFGVPRLPATAFLWIDTDVDNPETVEGKPGDYLSREARLESTEILDATVSPEQFTAYFRDAHQNPHIFSWIYSGVRKNGSIQHGARAVRPLGRLAFFHHVKDIRRRIVNAAQAAADLAACERMRTVYGIEVPSDSLNVVIVSSLAGGTGSGMFLDVSFLVRHLAAQKAIRSVNTLGYLVLPTVFAPATPETLRVYANAYAALKELEYYSMRKDLRDEQVGSARSVADAMSQLSAHDFVVDWEARRKPETVVGPPFNSAFLVGNAPAEGTEIPASSKGDLFDMIAENVFVDFSHRDFAVRKRSMRSNLEDFLKNDLEYGYEEDGRVIYRELFSYRFSAFGLSKLYVPVDRVRKACSARLAVELLDRWLAVNSPEGDLLAHIEQQEAEPLGVRAARGRDDLRAGLDRVDDKGETFAAAVGRFWSGEKRGTLRERVRQPEPGLRAALQHEFDQYGRTNFNDPPEEENWGQYLRRLRLVTGPQLQRDLEERLLGRLHEWLNAPRVRISLASEYLKALNHHLGKVRDEYRKRAETLRAEALRQRERWERVLGVIDEEERGVWVHRWSLRVLSDEACAVASRYFEHRIYSELFTVGARVCEAMQGFVGTERVETDARGEELTVRSGLVQQLFTLSGDLWEARREMQARLEAFDRTEEHLVFTNLYRPGMFRLFYRLRRTDGSFDEISDSALRDLEPQLRQELNIRSPYDVLAQVRDREIGPVRDQVESFCAARFRDLDEQAADAVRLLNELAKKKELRLDQELSRVVSRGNPWLVAGERAREGGTGLSDNYDAGALLGIDQGQATHPLYMEFLRGVRERVGQLRALKGKPASAVDTSRDTVFFYSELAGLPLAYIDRIERYRDAYRSLLENEFLHIDRHTERFTDIMLKTQEEVRLARRITRAVLLGVILHVLEVSGEGDEAQVVFVDGRLFPPVRRRIGTRSDAQELLAHDTRLLAQVEGAVTERTRRLTDILEQQFYTLLAYHVMDGHALGLPESGPFAEREVRVGDKTTTRVPVEHSAIRDALEEVQGRMADRRHQEPAEIRPVLDTVFRQWYARRAEFAREVQLGADRLLVMKQEVVSPLVAPMPITPTAAAAPASAPPAFTAAAPPPPDPPPPAEAPAPAPAASGTPAPVGDEQGLEGIFD